MSTTLAAALLALAGIVAVAGVSYVFYLVGRAEERDRAAAAPPPPSPSPEKGDHKPEPHPDHSSRNGRLARQRRRPLPPRRPQR